MLNVIVRQVLRVVLMVLIAGPAWAGGAWLYENGSPDLGVAGAGRAAAASDASTAFGNPAGMTHLDGTQIVFGVQIFQVQTFFDLESPPSNVSGGSGGNAGGFSPLPSWGGSAPATGLYGVYSLSNDLKLGLSVNSYLAASLDYDPNWSGRYFVQRADLLTLNFNPSIAYRVLPWLSVGAGMSVQYAKLVQKAAVNNFLDSVGDGRIIIHDANVGLGGNFGVLADAPNDWRFGLSYRSQVHQGFNDVASVSNLGPGLRALLEARGVLGHKVDMSVTVPQELMLSAYHQLTPSITLLANFDWQNWAEFGKPQLSVSGSSLTLNQQYQDTFGMAVGTQIRVADPWLLSLGFAYDTSAVDAEHRTAAFNIDNQYRWALGLQYAWSKITLGIAYEFWWLGSAPLSQSSDIAGTLQGDYSTNFVNFVNFSVSARL